MTLPDFLDIKDIVSHAADITLVAALLLFTTSSSKIKAWLEKQTNDKFERSINKNSRIRDQLAELRVLYGAERVLLFQLHNGQYYFSGEGADKLSLTHFNVDAGIAVPENPGTRLANIPFTYLPDLFKLMTEKGMFFVKTSDMADPFAAQMLSMDGVEACVVGPIKDRRSFWRGVLLICFMSVPATPDISSATAHAKRIADLMTPT